MLAIPIVVAGVHYILMLYVCFARPRFVRGFWEPVGLLPPSSRHLHGPSIKGENVDEIGCITRRRKW